MVWSRATALRVAGTVVTVATSLASVNAQVVRLGPATDSPPDQADTSRDGAAVPGKRIERMLARMSSERDPQLQSLNLREYVMVVGQQPEVSLFGTEPDLTGGAQAYGVPCHTEILAAVTPSDIRQAAGSDALGISTAALSMLIPSALDAVAGWFAGDDNPTPRGPRYASYTGSFRLDGAAAELSTRVSVVPFYRTAGQPVSLSATFEPEPIGGVIMTFDDRPFGVFDSDVNALRIPDELLQPGRHGDVHLLNLTRPTDATRADPVQVDVVVVVRERARRHALTVVRPLEARTTGSILEHKRHAHTYQVLHDFTCVVDLDLMVLYPRRLHVGECLACATQPLAYGVVEAFSGQ